MMEYFYFIPIYVFFFFRQVNSEADIITNVHEIMNMYEIVAIIFIFKTGTGKCIDLIFSFSQCNSAGINLCCLLFRNEFTL